MVFLDTQILFVAFGDIERSFPDVSTNAMSWVLSGYTLAFAALLVPAGRLADRWGRKVVFLGGLAVFTVASALCGLAPTAGLLIAARIVQAVGAAAITPTSLALVLRATPRERVPIAVAVWGSMGAVAAAFGPTLGGLLVDAAGWRWVFFLNLPFCVLGLLAGRRVLVESREAEPGPFPDLVGAALLALGVGAVSLALVQSEDWGWVDGRTIGSIAAGLVLTGLFVLRSRTQASPALDLSLFRIPSFRWGNLATAVFGLSFTAMFLANVTYLTSVWDWDVVKAGLAMAPGPIVVLLLARRFGRPGRPHRAPSPDHRRRPDLRARRPAARDDRGARRRTTRRRCSRRGCSPGSAWRSRCPSSPAPASRDCHPIATPSGRPSTRRCASSGPRSASPSSCRSSPAPRRATPWPTSSGRGG